jgi:hypothetical protein
MGLYFIWLTLSVGFVLIACILQDIKIELRLRNKLLEKQNEILEKL